MSEISTRTLPMKECVEQELEQYPSECNRTNQALYYAQRISWLALFIFLIHLSTHMCFLRKKEKKQNLAITTALV